MTIAAGTRLGPYEVLSPLGAGGMGEVYRARDTRLGREVAVKVLPADVAADAARLKRFEKEARSASALNHPAIVTIHDTGDSNGVSYIAMELVSGHTLREILVEGPLPVKRALQIAAQVAEGLSRAHEAGIVHRDLKPENVMVTPDGFAKILDFGLAKLSESGADRAATHAPTHTGGGTHPGVVMGTVGYMSPEQALGKPVDYRSDQFSFGSILYEMATGRRAFARGSSPETLSAIIRDDPEPIGALAPLTPAPLRWIVERCLAKNPADRYASTRDLARDLSGLRDRLSEVSGLAGSGAVAASPPVRRSAAWLPWAVAAAAVAAGLAALLLRKAPPPSPRPLVRFEMPPPPNAEFVSSFETTTLAVAPDGMRIAYLGGDVPPTQPISAGRQNSGVWVRDVATLQARRVAGTDDARSIFWSPDGRTLAFFTRNQLKRIDLAGGAPIPICDLPVGSGRSGTWGAGGDILFCNIQEATVWRVAASGGTPVRLIEGDTDRGELRFTWPWYLPDGKRFLYMVKMRGGGAELKFFEPGKPPRVLMPISSRVQYSEPGYLVFVRDGTLLAQRFDARSGRLSGDPFSVAESVSYFMTSGYATFATSESGTLVYQPHRDVSRIARFDRAGREVAVVSSSAFVNVALSPDGRRLLFDRVLAELGTLDVWSADLTRGVETRLTTSPGVEFAPLELPDGGIVFAAERGVQPQLCLRKAGSDAEDLIAPVPGAFQIPQAVSPDGRVLVYTERTANTPFDVWMLPLSPPGKPTPLLRSSASKGDVRISPDGRFLSLASDESGRSEVYVTPFPGPGERLRVSSDGGRLPRWSSGEISYLSLDGRVMAVPVRTAPTLEIETARELFRLSGKPWLGFIPLPDGTGFFAIVPEVAADALPMTVVLNWTEAAARK